MNIFDITFSSNFPQMIVRFVILMIVTWVIVDRLYFRKSHRRDFYFSFMLMSVAIFFLVYFMIFVLEDLKAKTSIGIGIGLFGIFSIMRYRTDAMPVREMTYMFVIIALSVVNAIANSVTIIELLASNAIVILCIWVCEARLKQEPAKLVQYDRIDLITPEHHDELLSDLRQRLGLDILRVEVGSVDFLRDMAMLKVYYATDRSHMSDNTIDQKTKLTREDLTQFPS